MSLKINYISLLEQLLMHLKNAKLVYLRAADVANHTEDKRRFNQEARLRNHFFQTVLSQLQRENIGLDDLVIRNFNFDQLLISSLNNRKSGVIEKCIEADSYLITLYQKVIALPIKDSVFTDQMEKINFAIAHCKDRLPVSHLVKEH